MVEGLVVGTTVKFVRGNVALAPAAGLTAGEALDTLDDVDGKTKNKFDLDVGIMMDMQKVRTARRSKISHRRSLQK